MSDVSHFGFFIQMVSFVVIFHFIPFCFLSLGMGAIAEPSSNCPISSLPIPLAAFSTCGAAIFAPFDKRGRATLLKILLKLFSILHTRALKFGHSLTIVLFV